MNHTSITLAGVSMVVFLAQIPQGSQAPPAQGGSYLPPGFVNPDRLTRGAAYSLALAEEYKLARRITANGEQAMAEGKLSEAETLFRKAISIFPHEPQAMLGLAPNWAAAHLEYGKALELAGDRKAAAVAFKKAAEISTGEEKAAAVAGYHRVAGY